MGIEYPSCNDLGNNCTCWDDLDANMDVWVRFKHGLIEPLGSLVGRERPDSCRLTERYGLLSLRDSLRQEMEKIWELGCTKEKYA